MALDFFSEIEITSGDAIEQQLTLYREDSDGTQVAAVLDSSDTIRASVKDAVDESVVYIAATAVSEATAGSDWANGIVVVTFTSVQADALTPFAPLEIVIEIERETTGGLEETWHTGFITCHRGSIN